MTEESDVPDSLPNMPALKGRTLLDELNHRIKNELASVIGTFLSLRSPETTIMRTPARPHAHGRQASDGLNGSASR